MQAGSELSGGLGGQGFNDELTSFHAERFTKWVSTNDRPFRLAFGGHERQQVKPIRESYIQFA